MLGPRPCARASSSCGKWGPLFITVRGPLTVMASLVAEHRLHTRRLSSCGSRAQPLCSTWDPPRPGLEPASPALAGRLSTTAPPGRPNTSVFISFLFAFVRKKNHNHKRTKFGNFELSFLSLLPFSFLFCVFDLFDTVFM